MQFYNYITGICLGLLLINCGDASSKLTRLSININTKSIAIGDTLNLSINNPKQLNIESITYKLNGKPIKAKEVLNDVKLGNKQLSATVTYDGKTQQVSKRIIIYNNKKANLYTYEIVNTYPHDNTSYTQGLEFFNNDLYESTGKRKTSKLRKIDFKSGKILKNLDLEPTFFGEGLTVLNNKVYQLTWQAGIGFVYDINTFEKLNTFKYGNSKEGWGLCNDGEKLYKSDGTENIWVLDPKTLTEEYAIQVYNEKAKISNLNELEWVDGKIYTNVYTTNVVAIINPNNGALDGVIDFAPLKKLVTLKDPEDEVLNGLAYHSKRNTLFVTGKKWDKIFEVKIEQK